MLEILDRAAAVALCGAKLIDELDMIQPSFGFWDPEEGTTECTAYLPLPEGGVVVALWVFKDAMLEQLWAVDGDKVWPLPDGYHVQASGTCCDGPPAMADNQ